MKHKNNFEYEKLIEPILNNKKFMQSQSTIHHGINKIDHSLKVAYYSYKISKIFDMDHISATRGALLHDFFFSNTNGISVSKEAIKLTFNHHEIALDNANKNFILNDIEKDIIVKHMFPVVPNLPKYKESYLVAFIDKVVGTSETLGKFTKHINYKLLSKVIPGFILAISII